MTCFRDKIKIICILLMSVFIVGGWTPSKEYGDFKNHVTSISALSIPKGTVIVGVGEATHGNKEFVQIKQEIFKQLVQNDGYKVFALEGDFGGAQVVNDYIVNGNGTAKEAVHQIGFAIYKTQEMVDLVEWMHDYNLSVPENKKVHFYGFDMQRYDNNKKGLLTYIQKVNPKKYKEYGAALLELNDESVFNQSQTKVLSGLKAIEGIMEEMNKDKKKHILQSSEKEFDLAYEYANCIKQNAVLRGTAKNYSSTRDAFMAAKVQWILSFEKKLGNDKLFIAGHNGHIEKSAAAPTYQSMGNILAKIFKDQYYAVGTEFYESTFNCKDSRTNERREFYLKNNETNKLATLFKETEMESGFLDFDKVMKQPIYKELFTTKCQMNNIGDEFNEIYKASIKLYTLSMVPSEAYDGLVFVRKATPTTMLNKK